MATVIVLAILVTVVTIAIITIVKNVTRGKCTGCPLAGKCHKHNKHD